MRYDSHKESTLAWHRVAKLYTRITYFVVGDLLAETGIIYW